MSSETRDEKETELIEVLDEVKPIDISPLLIKDESERAKNSSLILSTGKLIRESFEKYGVVIIRDPRVTYEKNEEFLNMIEDYFNQSTNIKNKDIRPELSFQIGATPSKQETARNHCQRIKNIYDNNNNNIEKAEINTLDPKHKPWTPCPPEADPKWRYFWRLGSQGVNVDTNDEKEKEKDRESSPNTKKEKKDYVMLNATNVIPEGFDNWPKLCDEWGMGLLNAANTIAEGIAIGYNLSSRDYFTSRMINAPHLLAPTATDLNKFNKYGTIIAGYHYDLNFITVHGKSRYPGLSIFLRNGKKVRVKVPNGCLLAQAAKQLEWITGGKIYAGFHEVCVNESTIDKIKKVQKINEEIIKNNNNNGNNKRISPLWRISSTMFSHINSNVILEPIKNKDITNNTNVIFSTKESLNKYPSTKALTQVIGELKMIGLMINDDNNNSIGNNNNNNNNENEDLIAKIDNLIEYVETIPSN